MYKTIIFAAAIVFFCDINVIISKPLPEPYENLLLVRDDGTLAVQGLEIFSKIGIDFEKKQSGQPPATLSIKSSVPLQKTVLISPEAAKQALNVLDPDTKKQFYLLKIKEYYDFLPLNRQEHDKYLRLEIVDRGDVGYFDHSEHDDVDEDVLAQGLVKRSADSDISEQRQNSDSSVLIKRDISDDTLKQNINIFQTHYVGKREIRALPISKLYERSLISDLGNFYSNSESLTSDPDDPQNNNFRHVAYVPFFRIKKYYIERNRLDVGL